MFDVGATTYLPSHFIYSDMVQQKADILLPTSVIYVCNYTLKVNASDIQDELNTVPS